MNCKNCDKELIGQQKKYCSIVCNGKAQIGIKFSLERREKIREKALARDKSVWLRGKDHYRWKGDNVGYAGLHAWVRRNKPKPEFCEECGKVPPRDLANISGKYLRDVNDYEWLCRRCHQKSDGRLEANRLRLKELGKVRYIGDKNPRWKGGKPKCVVCGKEIKGYRAKRCWGCNIKNR